MYSSGFYVEDESDNYRLHIDGYSGTAGNGILEENGSWLLDGMQFSTMDRDNDLRNQPWLCSEMDINVAKRDQGHQPFWK